MIEILYFTKKDKWKRFYYKHLVIPVQGEQQSVKPILKNIK